ncbi:MAG: hypothetical protein FWC50_06915 [Planctomycetaceae bacterium]|nr:hypothetical protein [Planctomycetaceae bacterium]
MDLKRISILLLGGILLAWLPGCASRYQNAVDRSMLIQENLQLDQALSLAQYRLTILEDENRRLRRELGQESSSDNRRTTYGNAKSTVPNYLDNAGRSNVPYQPAPTSPDTILPAPNPPGRIPPMFLNPREQNRNRPLSNGASNNDMPANPQQMTSDSKMPAPQRVELPRTSPLQMPASRPVVQAPGQRSNTLPMPGHVDSEPSQYRWSPNRPDGNQGISN